MHYVANSKESITCLLVLFRSLSFAYVSQFFSSPPSNKLYLYASRNYFLSISVFIKLEKHEQQ